MKVLRGVLTKGFLRGVSALAMFIGITSVSQACFLTFNQPKVPECMDKYKKQCRPKDVRKTPGISKNMSGVFSGDYNCYFVEIENDDI